MLENHHVRGIHDSTAANNQRMAGPDEQEATALLDYLAHRDVACPLCGYNLRGLLTASCPECNQTLALRVGLQEATGGAYIGAIVGLSVGAGTAMLLTIFHVIWMFRHGLPGGGDALYLLPYPATATVLGIPLFLLTTRRGRRWFAGRSVVERQAAVILAWILSLTAFGVWVALIMPS